MTLCLSARHSVSSEEAVTSPNCEFPLCHLNKFEFWVVCTVCPKGPERHMVALCLIRSVVWAHGNNSLVAAGASCSIPPRGISNWSAANICCFAGAVLTNGRRHCKSLWQNDIAYFPWLQRNRMSSPAVALTIHCAWKQINTALNWCYSRRVRS